MQNRESKWQVVALGEAQLDSGVGGSIGDYNEITDGPNRDAQLLDNAFNSPEQEVANENWTNLVVTLLNRGEPDEAIIAELAHDGCPHPAQYLARGKQQQAEVPQPTTEMQNPLENPPPQDDPAKAGQMQGLSQQPPQPAYSRVRIAGKTWKTYASEMKYAGESDSTVDGDAHPVSEIEKFISNMPVVEPTRPHIEARVKNIETARRAIRGLLSKATYADQARLAALDAELADEQSGLKSEGANYLTIDAAREAYLTSRPFQYNAFSVADATYVPFTGNVKEAALIWVSESPYRVSSTQEDFTFSAIQKMESLGLNGDQATEFMTTAQAALRAAPTTKTASAPADFEGPAEELFN